MSASKLKNNSLSLVAAALFLASLVGQSLAGQAASTLEQQDHGEPTVGFAGYLGTGHFGEAVFENWESEFLQMAMFIFLTAFLVQKGSAESRKPDDDPGAAEEEAKDDPEPHRHRPGVPWPVRHGGLAMKVYENSLSLAFFVLFLVTFALHAATGAAEFSEEQAEHGGQAVGALGYLGEPRFWFESFQNWQSEFLAVLSVVLLSIVLRQRGSPESKPVYAPHGQTGQE